MDLFVLYGVTYKKLRESMSGAMYGNQIEELGEATQVLCLLILIHLCVLLLNPVYCAELETTRSGPFPAGTLRESNSQSG